MVGGEIYKDFAILLSLGVILVSYVLRSRFGSSAMSSADEPASGELAR